MRTLMQASLAIIFALFIAAPLLADGKSPAGDSQRERFFGVTPEREAAALTFVRQHHEELSELLMVLKEQSPKDFDKALRDLFRDSEKLAQLKERDERRYELELKHWKIKSRLQLLSARMTMVTDPSEAADLREQMRRLLVEQIDVRAALVRRDRDRLAERLNKIDQQLQQLQDNRDALVERGLRALTGVKGESRKKGSAKRTSRQKGQDKTRSSRSD